MDSKLSDSKESDASENDDLDEASGSLDESTQPHIMLSYQWDDQKLVEDVYAYLKSEQDMPVWMDKYGGMQDNVLLSMSQGVENCAVLVCFLTPAYQNSLNCQSELRYALERQKQIIPCIVGSKEQGVKWQPTDWLGLKISRYLYLDFSNVNAENFQSKCQQLLQRIYAATKSS